MEESSIILMGIVSLHTVFSAFLCWSWIMFYHKGLVKKYGHSNVVHNDIMNYIFYRNDRYGFSLGFWSLSHFLYFANTAMFMSQQLFEHYSSSSINPAILCTILATFLGIIWEIIEDLLSKCIGKKRSIKNEKHTRRFINDDSNIYYSTWWTGTGNDIVVNLLGLSLALFMRFMTPMWMFSMYEWIIQSIHLSGAIYVSYTNGFHYGMHISTFLLVALFMYGNMIYNHLWTLSFGIIHLICILGLTYVWSYIKNIYVRK